MSTFAGNVSRGGGYSGDYNLATKAALSYPYGVTATSGTVFIVDTSNNVIRAVNLQTAVIVTASGTWYNPSIGGGRYSDSAAAPYLNGPTGMAVDPVAGVMFIADAANNAIRKVVLATGAVSTVAGMPGAAAGYSGNGLLATKATLNYPSAVALGPDGSLFIADTKNNVIRCVNKTTGKISTVAGNHQIGLSFSGDGAAATLAGLNRPAGGHV